MAVDMCSPYKWNSVEVVNNMEDVEQQWRSLCEQLDFTVDETNKQRKAVELILVRVDVFLYGYFFLFLDIF